MALPDLRLGAFLDELAAAEGGTPGGGALAAVVTAAAAGLLANVARSSADEWAEARSVAAQAEALRDRAAPLAQVNADAYEAALRSTEDPAAEPSERRNFEVGRAYARAAEPPLMIVEAATDVAHLAVVVARNGNPAFRADAAGAAALAAAAARAATELVAVNLTTSEDDQRVVRARMLADEAASAAADALTEE